MKQIIYSILTLIISAIIIFGCSEDTIPTTPNMPGTDPMEFDGTIWEGSNIEFAKQDNTDPTDDANQDRLTDKVILTRSNTGGQIFNIAEESRANKVNSPIGTEWALGRTADIENLSFAPFRSTVGDPKNVAGKNLVLHLIEDDIYLNINFSSWTSGKAGGFSYTRATE